MLRICGFNGFQQIDNLVESSGNLENGSRIHKFLKCKEEDCRDVDMTWSNILISKGKVILCVCELLVKTFPET